MQKKEIPLVVLKTIKSILDQHNNFYCVKIKSESILLLVDKDEASPYFFEIKNTKLSENQTIVTIAFQPKNSYDISAVEIQVKLETLPNYINAWVTCLEEYNVLGDIFEDPVLKSNSERFLSQFEMEDSDADYATFNLEQQLFIDNYLNQVKEKLTELKTELEETDQHKINELLLDARIISKGLTKLSKKKTMEKLAKFWGKAQKLGLVVIKEIFVNYVSELTKTLLLP